MPKWAPLSLWPGFRSFTLSFANMPINGYLRVLGQFSTFFSFAGASTQGQLLGPGRGGLRPAAPCTEQAFLGGQCPPSGEQQGLGSRVSFGPARGPGQKVATGVPLLAGVLQPCCFGLGADRCALSAPAISSPVIDTSGSLNLRKAALIDSPDG